MLSRIRVVAVRPAFKPAFTNRTIISVPKVSKAQLQLKLNASPSIIQSFRTGASLDPTTFTEIEERVMYCLKLYDKIDPNTVTLNSNFSIDLGLDSLDITEVIVMIEKEFHFEIPEEESDNMLTPREICDYLGDCWNVSVQ